MEARPLRILTLATCLLPLAPASAQNCANTTTGLVPLTDLGAGTHQGFQGGLYPGGSNAMPVAHLVDGMREALQVVPRDAAGNPSPTGKIVFISVGMSNATQEFSRFVQLANADPSRSPGVLPVDCAQGGQTADDIDDPAAPYWSTVAQRLANAGVTAAQVQVVWLKEANAQPTDPFPQHAQTLQAQYTTILQILRTKFPNARLAYMASRIYAGYATTPLNPEPYAYEQGFVPKWLIEAQIGGDPALEFDPARGPVLAPWLAWGTYNWADGLVPRGDGLVWECSDFNTDGTHPAAGGREKVAQALLAFVRADPIAAAWYLARPAPHAYGTGKLTSIGTLPVVGWTGTPSLAANDFAFTYTGAVPGKTGIGFVAGAPALAPWLGGTTTRWFSGPTTRLPAHTLDGSGGTSYPISIQPAMVGTTRFYQGLSRDPMHPDGTGLVATNGLRVVFSP